eukprot:6027362-Pleurochrysis_carterae.AAC.1
MWPALFTQAGDFDVSTMTHLCELIRSNLLRNMESDANVMDVSWTVETLVGSLMDGFSDPADPVRAPFRSCTNPPSCIAKHARIPSSSLTRSKVLRRQRYSYPTH